MCLIEVTENSCSKFRILQEYFKIQMDDSWDLADIFLNISNLVVLLEFKTAHLTYEFWDKTFRIQKRDNGFAPI